MKYRGWNYAEFTRRESLTAPLRSSLRVSTNLVLALPTFSAAQRRLYTLFRIPNWRNELERLGLRCVWFLFFDLMTADFDDSGSIFWFEDLDLHSELQPLAAVSLHRTARSQFQLRTRSHRGGSVASPTGSQFWSRGLGQGRSSLITLSWRLPLLSNVPVD
jgi:hypothetical protein